ncbi:histidine kinase [Terrimicrobium sacchariphilum]|uniref:histidine kinase n=1 Tax=Terrimicrobium sacchariphilum TaxID=690879 RepID=A0A146GCP3_TERSA|nr:histidine kinase [Terrimicrobium sacchariphilum]GAT35335.1 histidine kinase [Terrimicrobium sacchariphilum]
MMRDFLIIARWGALLDWILFAGAVAFTLAALIAFRLGSPRLEQTRNVNWLLLAASSALSAIGMVLPLVGHLDMRASGVLFATTIVLGITSTTLVILMARRLDFPSFAVVGTSALSFGVWGAISLCVVYGPQFPLGGSAIRPGHPLEPEWTSLAAAIASMIGIGLCCWINLRHLESLPGYRENRPAFLKGLFIYGAAIVLVLVAGLLASLLRERQYIAAQADRLGWRVNTAALGLNLDALLRLSGKPSDQKMPAYSAVTKQLKKILQANADAQNAYIWTFQESSPILLAHEGIKNPESLLLDSYTRSDTGPYVTWSPDQPFATAHQHIVNPTDKQPYAWLAMDFDLSSWLDAIAEARLQIIGASFLAVLVVTACYGWVLGIEIERASEREKLALVVSERERFARDLHDGLGQTLTGLAYRARALARGMQGRAAEDAGEFARMLTDAVAEARAIAFAQIPPALKNGGLRGGLQWLAANTHRLFEIQCTLDLPTDMPAFPEQTDHALLQIARESVHNAIRHGNASVVSLALHRNGKAWLFEVRDNGNGELPKSAIAGGLGLRMITTRVRELHGTAEFLPNSPSGVIVRCRFPG